MFIQAALGRAMAPDCWVHWLGWGRASSQTVVPDSLALKPKQTENSHSASQPVQHWEVIGWESGEDFKQGQHLLGFSNLR